MSEVLRSYRGVNSELPETIKRWHLYGAGFEALEEVTVPMPTYSEWELLVRHDAVGICFSDIKIITQGPNHPRLQGRDMKSNPVVMGHEVALTVVGVGEQLQAKFQLGQRFIIQADVYYQGENPCYGYQLSGGMAQYGVVTREVLEGDEGCYLLPITDTTNDVAAALVEPWACVVASYEYPNYRNGLLQDGNLLVVNIHGTLSVEILQSLCVSGHESKHIVTVTVKDDNDNDWAERAKAEIGGAGFDDIVVYGTPNVEQFSQIANCLGKRGIVNILWDTPFAQSYPLDVGRVHYEQQLFIGAGDASKAKGAYVKNQRQDLKAGGKAWFIGAGGPMGQMHIQRAVMQGKPPKQLVVSDRHDNRLARIEERFGAAAKSRDIELILLNTKTGDDPMAYGPFDDIVSMVPNAPYITESMPALGENGVYNLFAGLGKGTLSELDMGTMLAKNQRIIGTSGSSLADLRHTLELVEQGSLSTNSSLAAIGGLNSFRDGLKGVKEGRFPGKTVIFPQLPSLPLMSIEEVQNEFPKVFAKMKDGLFLDSGSGRRTAERNVSTERMKGKTCD